MPSWDIPKEDNEKLADVLIYLYLGLLAGAFITILILGITGVLD